MRQFIQTGNRPKVFLYCRAALSRREARAIFKKAGNREFDGVNCQTDGGVALLIGIPLSTASHCYLCTRDPRLRFADISLRLLPDVYYEQRDVECRREELFAPVGKVKKKGGDRWQLAATGLLARK